MSRMDRVAWSEIETKGAPFRAEVSTYFTKWEIGIDFPYFLYSLKITPSNDSARDEIDDWIFHDLEMPIVEEFERPDETEFLVRRNSKLPRPDIYFTLWTYDPSPFGIKGFEPLTVSEDKKVPINRSRLLHSSLFDAISSLKPHEWQHLPVLRRSLFYVPSSSLGITEGAINKSAKEHARLFASSSKRENGINLGSAITLSSESLAGFVPLLLNVGYQELALLAALNAYIKSDIDMSELSLTGLSFFELPMWPPSNVLGRLPLTVMPKNLLYACIANFRNKFDQN